MDVKALTLTLALAGLTPIAQAYTLFGPDLKTPIFPVNGTLKVYKAKTDEKPFAEFHDLPHYAVGPTGFADTCLGKSEDGWVRCNIKGKAGWVRRSDFLSGAQYQPQNQWPIRYWLASAGGDMPGEEADELMTEAKRNPYLVPHKEITNVLFKVQFDKEGFATSVKTGKRTGDRVFKVGNAIYLAPADDAKREKATWQFLNYFEPSIQAMCPSVSKESCYSAANQASDWPGISMLRTSPPAQFAYNAEREDQNKVEWFGQEKVGFARFSDPVKPLMYKRPDGKPHCVMDCR
ncbi:hypothetical protein [Pseudoduganella violaceinigra]|uniref:hypothetical protein n=1 Tax=Pseudoduganella violaceinigra TaxID=246602 RepID=UPI000484E30A|nr:hypothetical protein [Pseudoduganella violaceinigra]